MVATRTTAETSVEELAELMVGRRVLLRVEKGPAPGDGPVLSVANLTVRDSRGVDMVKNVSFDVRAGEIVGIAGVAGNGQSELLRRSPASAADRRGPSARRPIHAAGPLPRVAPPAWPMCPRTASAWGWCSSSMKARTPFSAITRPEISPRPVSRPRRDPQGCEKDKIQIRYPPAQPVPAHRQFLRRQPAEDRAGPRDRARPEVLIVGQPTRGVDVGAIEFIHKRIIEMRDAGKASCWSRSSSTRSAPVRPRAGDVRRAHRRRMLARDQRRRDRAADGIPLINLIVAFLVAGLVVLAVGESPLRAASLLIEGAFGYGEGIGFTLYYATNFIFTGLAVAVAFHCGLFNIGGEGQAYVAGLGVALPCLWLDQFMPWYIIFPAAILGSALVGGFWAMIPGWLQAKRGSHVVITTIMFNFIASSLMVYVLVDVLKPAGSMAPQTRTFADGGQLPRLDWLLASVGLDIGGAPFNMSFLLALVAAFVVWVVIWRTKLGYEIRTMGHSPRAARYAGIRQSRIIIITMMMSGRAGRHDGAQSDHGRPAPHAA
jgi:ABC-type uncharacterized transport system permease subunit